MATTGSGNMVQVLQSDFGTMPDGRAVQRFDIRNAAGVEVSVITYGATIISARTPDRQGNVQEITLQHHTLDHIREKSKYFGATVGRVANRTKEGKFRLGGKDYTLAINNGPNHLHGGLQGFDKVIWTATQLADGVEMSYVSPDGDEGYPGEVRITVSFRLLDAGRLVIDFRATTDAETPINIVNHTYWNLSGDLSKNIKEHKMRMSCSRYLPVDDTQVMTPELFRDIPTGELAPVSRSGYDFTSVARIGDALDQLPDGIDHCYVVDDQSERDDLGCAHIATAVEPTSGRTMMVRGTQPGVQFYTGNFLSGDSKEFPYTKHMAFCLETQHFPNSANQPDFPSIILRPNDEYRHTAQYIFGVQH